MRRTLCKQQRLMECVDLHQPCLSTPFGEQSQATMSAHNFYATARKTYLL